MCAVQGNGGCFYDGWRPEAVGRLSITSLVLDTYGVRSMQLCVVIMAGFAEASG